MRCIKFLVDYEGTDYVGWQVQKKGITVQGVLQDSLSTITDENITVTGASRTDAGVHAIGQVAAFKTNSNLPVHVISRALNATLPDNIRVRDVKETFFDFHPRFNAKKKVYSYFISNTNSIPFFIKKYVWLIRQPLQYEPMARGAEMMIGERDFSSFRAADCGSKHAVRRIINLESFFHSSMDFMTIRYKVPVIQFRIEGNSFLRHMVRNIIGTLVEIGRGRLKPEDLFEIMERKDRTFAGPTAPASGLFLEQVHY